MTAFEQGAGAYWDGVERRANPHPMWSRPYLDWADGWLQSARLELIFAS